MSIPANARVRAIPAFADRLHAARAFMAAQDAESATARFQGLQQRLVNARELLSFSPASGRPARFLESRTGWGQFQAHEALQLARKLGMTDLRELVVARHVLLYAHSEREVVLLSLRHERQVGYRFAAPD